MTRYIFVYEDIDDYRDDSTIEANDGLFVPEDRYYDVQSKRITEAADIIKSCIDVSNFYRVTLNNRLKRVVDILNN